MAFASPAASTPTVITHRIDPFNSENFLTMLENNKEKFMNRPLIQELGINQLYGQPPMSPIRWGQCEDDLEIFTMDFEETVGTPNPPTKGLDVELNLIGVLNDPVEIDHINIQCEWEEAPVYEEEKPLNAVFDDIVNYKTSWPVPTYAMEGSYVAYIRGVTPDGDIAFCASAGFAF